MNERHKGHDVRRAVIAAEDESYCVRRWVECVCLDCAKAWRTKITNETDEKQDNRPRHDRGTDGRGGEAP
jgi:hypothetical protein